uniref:Peptidoglycan-recognition protein n=1 Tax=Glossina brevipalpis TaxID=37001 RepID=A0A1A9W1I3_9MUSC
MFKIIVNILLTLTYLLAIVNCNETADCPSIKLKQQWGGRRGSDINYRPIPVKYVIIHHTVTPECDSFVTCSELLQNMQSYHMQSLKYDDIGYNFLIGSDGNVYEGTGWLIIGAHTYGYNTNGTGIAFIGDYTAKLPTDAALIAAKKLLDCGVKMGNLQKNYELMGGGQVFPTKSPGLTLYNEIQQWDHWTPNFEDQ